MTIIPQTGPFLAVANLVRTAGGSHMPRAINDFLNSRQGKPTFISDLVEQSQRWRREGTLAQKSADALDAIVRRLTEGHTELLAWQQPHKIEMKLLEPRSYPIIPPWAAAFGETGEIFAVSSGDNVTVRSTNSLGVKERYETDGISALCLVDVSGLLWGAQLAKLYYWNIAASENQEPTSATLFSNDTIRSLAPAHDEGDVHIGTFRGKIWLYSATKKPVQEIFSGDTPIIAMAYSIHNRILAAAEQGRRIALFYENTLVKSGAIAGNSNVPIRSLCFAGRQEDYLLAGMDDGTVEVLDSHSLQSYSSAKIGKGAILALMAGELFWNEIRALTAPLQTQARLFHILPG